MNLLSYLKGLDYSPETKNSTRLTYGEIMMSTCSSIILNKISVLRMLSLTKFAIKTCLSTFMTFDSSETMITSIFWLTLKVLQSMWALFGIHPVSSIILWYSAFFVLLTTCLRCWQRDLIDASHAFNDVRFSTTSIFARLFCHDYYYF